MKPLKIQINESQVGARIRKIRLARGLTVSELARRVEVPVSTLRDWEYGRTILGEPYSKVAQALDVHVLEILEGKVPNEVFTDIIELERLLTKIKAKL